jgi:type IV pilus assembly protein PilY1
MSQSRGWSKSWRYGLLVLAAGLCGDLATKRLVTAAVGTNTSPIGDASCTESAAPVRFAGPALDEATPIKSSVVFDPETEVLKLSSEGAKFSRVLVTVPSTFRLGCAGDFDEDGWVDIATGGEKADNRIAFFRNRTFENPAPSDWNDPQQIREPKFVVERIIEPSTSNEEFYFWTACADFNNDGHMDFVMPRSSDGTTDITTATATSAKLFLGRGDGTFETPYNFVDDLTVIGPPSDVGPTGAVPYDYNQDGRMDLVIGRAGSTTKGSVAVLLSDGQPRPKFNTVRVLLTNMNMTKRGVTALVYADVTNDSIPDLVVSGVGVEDLRVYPGILGGAVSTDYHLVPFAGAGVTMLAGNFHRPGRVDLFVGTENWAWPGSRHQGGYGFLYKNDGSSTPFSTVEPDQISVHQDPHTVGSMIDFDSGLAINYDNDPQNSLDLFAFDGNQSQTFFMFVNRPAATAVNPKGSIQSSTLDLGTLTTAPITVTGVELAPTQVVPAGTSIQYEASNDGGISWTAAPPCASNAAHYCAALDQAAGRAVQWRATLNANEARTLSPTVSGMEVRYSYVTAITHTRGGPVASEGLIYVGAFTEPGSAGHLYAVNDQTSEKIWDSAQRIDIAGDTTRTIFTATRDGKQRLQFHRAEKNNLELHDALGTCTSIDTERIIDWQRSARFGWPGIQSPQTLGAIMQSTPAVLTPPHQPFWYPLASTTPSERQEIDAYVNAYANRPRLVFVNAKDGGLHAFRTDPSRLGDPSNGTEAWSFIPQDVAERFNADMANGVISAYPDAAPTLANVKLNGAWRTVLVSGEGYGGAHVFALDVTDTIAADGTVIGPTPLWQFSDYQMGHSTSKPTVIRVKEGEAERWLAVFANGVGTAGPQSTLVFAVDIATGQLMWTFDSGDASSFPTTDVTAAETDDPAEANGATIDGYVDRIFVGDSKGRIWKLDDQGRVVGAPVNVGLESTALFSTKTTPNALGVERPIFGTIAAAPDADRHLVLYFGTGTPDSTDPTEINAFYAVYSHTGAIRSALNPSAAVPAGTKFTGGVVINDGQLILATGRDLSSAGLCAPSEGSILGVDMRTFAVQFAIPTAAKIVSSLFVRNGQYYTTDLQGRIQTSSYTGTNDPTGSSSSSGTYSTESTSSTTGGNVFSLVSYNQRQ